MREIPQSERLILIEDAPELHVEHENVVGLIATRGGLREADVTVEDLLVASLRMRPNRIILGEVRGGEASIFLRAINTGHPGSLCTIHANSSQNAVLQLAYLAMQSATGMNWDALLQYIRSSIDAFVHLERVLDRVQISSWTASSHTQSGS